MARRVAILQSNYVPWRGYFDMIAHVDDFVIYDEVQFTKNDWRNRNIIKTPQGTAWLTVPVHADLATSIFQTRIAGGRFAAKHWRTLQMNYSRAPHFDEIARWLAPIYENGPFDRISLFNHQLIGAIAAYIGIGTRLHWSHDIETAPGKTRRLVEICRALHAEIYVSGPAARDYLEVEQFEAAGIAVEWFDYSGYPEYAQLWGGFEPRVSVLDLLFNCGSASGQYLRHFRPGSDFPQTPQRGSPSR